MCQPSLLGLTRLVGTSPWADWISPSAHSAVPRFFSVTSRWQCDLNVKNRGTVECGFPHSTVLRFFSVKLHWHCSSTVKKQWLCTTPKTPRNRLETASARALVKWPILTKMSILLRKFGHASGPGFGPQGGFNKIP